MNGLPITSFQLKKSVRIIRAIIGLFITVLVIGNIVYAIFFPTIKVKKNTYTVKQNFPFFTNNEAYIKALKEFEPRLNIKITYHEVTNHESLWDISYRSGLSIDTIIAANPFMTSLEVSPGMVLALPAQNGVLQAIDNFTDAKKMAKILNYQNEIVGDYKPHIFNLISSDDIKFCFYPNAHPRIVNSNLQKLCNIRRQFKRPLKEQHYTSLFGNRMHPIYHRVAFHYGIDIAARLGTPITPAREGLVSFSGWRSGYGKLIVIQHKDGFETMYGHCLKLLKQEGDFVTTEDKIALVGSTGKSTGPHLHFSILHHGKYLNPLGYIW